MAREADRQILQNYKLQPSNFLAVERLPVALAAPGVASRIKEWQGPFDSARLAAEKTRFEERLTGCTPAEQHWWLLQYANPVISASAAACAAATVSDQGADQGQ